VAAAPEILRSAGSPVGGTHAGARAQPHAPERKNAVTDASAPPTADRSPRGKTNGGGVGPPVGGLGKVVPSMMPSDQQIRERAYFIYLNRGGAPGDPMADWLQAERELREASAPKAN
jgi:hypothetical protein